MPPLKGVIEGFSWPSDHAIDGHWGELRPEERMYLVAAMHTWGFDTFVYDPTSHRERNADPVTHLMDPGHWPATFDAARDHGVSFIWGLAPGSDRGGLMDGVERLLDLGVDGVALLFDEEPGDDPEKQCRAQGYLARNLEARFPGAVKAFRGFHGEGAVGHGEAIASLLDEELPQGVGLLCSGGEDGTRLDRSTYPTLQRRKIWAWDRALAIDDPDPSALRVGPVAGRTAADLEGLGAWLVEMTFPLSRAIPAIAGAGLGVEATGDAVTEGVVRSWKRWFHDIETEALETLFAVATGNGVVDDLSERHKLALRSKPDLRRVVDRLIGPAPDLM